MKLPQFLFNPKARLLFKLWKQERRANARLRRELLEWQNATLSQARLPKLFQPPPKPVESIRRPPIGLTDKLSYMAEQRGSHGVPTAEDILAAAERVNQ